MLSGAAAGHFSQVSVKGAFTKQRRFSSLDAWLFSWGCTRDPPVLPPPPGLSRRRRSSATPSWSRRAATGSDAPPGSDCSVRAAIGRGEGAYLWDKRSLEIGLLSSTIRSMRRLQSKTAACKTLTGVTLSYRHRQQTYVLNL